MVGKWFILLIAVLCLVGTVFAAPTTQAATAVTNNGATLNVAGATGEAWFMYGQTSGSLSWKTPNTTTTNYSVYGSPLIGSTKFYFKACDGTGCGSELFFTTSALTPQPQTTFGAGLDNITNSQYDIETIAHESIGGYFWLVPTFPSIVWGLLFFGIYLGLWIRERDMVVPVILGLISGSFVMFNDSGLQLGIPVEFQALAQGLTYAALAGVILAIMKRS
jgi:hypothetical protein